MIPLDFKVPIVPNFFRLAIENMADHARWVRYVLEIREQTLTFVTARSWPLADVGQDDQIHTG